MLDASQIVGKKSLKSIKLVFTELASITSGHFTIRGTRVPASVDEPLAPATSLPFKSETIGISVPLSPVKRTSVLF